MRLIGIGVSGLSPAAEQLRLLDDKGGKLTRLNEAVDRIRRRYGFRAIETGRVMQLRDIFPQSDKGYKLNTPSLSR